MEAAELQFLVGGGVLVGTAKHLGTEERDQLTIEAMSTEALTTSEIREKRGTDLAQYDPSAVEFTNEPSKPMRSFSRVVGCLLGTLGGNTFWHTIDCALTRS